MTPIKADRLKAAIRDIEEWALKLDKEAARKLPTGDRHREHLQVLCRKLAALRAIEAESPQTDFYIQPES